MRVSGASGKGAGHAGAVPAHRRGRRADAPGSRARGRALALPRVRLTRLGAPLLDARVAATFVSRLLGLHALPSLGPTDALVISPCRSVQTWGMPCAIDVVFLDAEGIVLEIRTLARNATAFHSRARRVVEAAAGSAERLALAPGQRLLPDGGAWT